MKRTLIVLTTVGFVVASSFGVAVASPGSDLKDLKGYFSKKFPNVKSADYQNGVYALDADSREQWKEMEEFPPYEDFVILGEKAWNTKFKNGKTYASCFKGTKTSNIRVKFPHWNAKKSRVETLEGALMDCAKANGSKLKAKKGKITYISGYLAHKARGQKINVVIPNNKKAKAAYAEGKRFFYAKRGQLNLSCADCHVYFSGSRVRADNLSPALGHTTHFPVFRGKWAKNPKGDGLGTLHRRYGGCNKNVRAKPFKAQSTEYRNLEFFHAYMSNGQVINGPGYRK